MIDIVLKDGQSGYDAVGEYIKRYLKYHPTDTVVISLAISYNGKDYGYLTEVACLEGFDDILYFLDWWEGEKYIRLFGIRGLEFMDICGGIYEAKE